jgi:hypothetical protein
MNTYVYSKCGPFVFQWLCHSALTINKAQGLTLTRVGLFLDKDVFAHGQMYVGMSRVSA